MQCILKRPHIMLTEKLSLICFYLLDAEYTTLCDKSVYLLLQFFSFCLLYYFIIAIKRYYLNEKINAFK